MLPYNNTIGTAQSCHVDLRYPYDGITLPAIPVDAPSPFACQLSKLDKEALRAMIREEIHAAIKTIASEVSMQPRLQTGLR